MHNNIKIIIVQFNDSLKKDMCFPNRNQRQEFWGVQFSGIRT